MGSPRLELGGESPTLPWQGFHPSSDVMTNSCALRLSHSGEMFVVNMKSARWGNGPFRSGTSINFFEQFHTIEVAAV